MNIGVQVSFSVMVFSWYMPSNNALAVIFLMLFNEIQYLLRTTYCMLSTMLGWGYKDEDVKELAFKEVKIS